MNNFSYMCWQVITLYEHNAIYALIQGLTPVHKTFAIQ